ncbi:MAG: hypothetical protein HXX15_19450 [Rhodopseudomonas sp.]|uniref:hypothetical protein n=1 Tax=Rhodopseudomonas sp. TaxID=1078 RepID=UPI00185E92DE|nr:hypothetical protein [Rhodopseudomonas sp.]NVN88263.1 hypothetical protein [Rhodopseudomonas sp.]
MTSRSFVAGVLAVVASISVAAAQQLNRSALPADASPRLADIMEAIQARHIKLWFAGKNHNWDLAAYEAAQIRARLEDAARFYQDLPVTEVTTMGAPLDALSEAVKAKDTTKFASAFDQLTAGCNSCHQSIERSFIAIQTPTAQPFSNQSFAPAKK